VHSKVDRGALQAQHGDSIKYAIFKIKGIKVNLEQKYYTHFQGGA
jgi:hypothetical protein